MQIVHKNIYNNLKNKYQNHFAKFCKVIFCYSKKLAIDID